MRINCPGVSRSPPRTTGRGACRTLWDLFLKYKRVQGVSSDVQGKYTRELARLRTFCESQGVHTVQRINREILTEFCATWAYDYPSTITRAKVRERLRGFLKYCYEAQWLPRIPQVPKLRRKDLQRDKAKGILPRGDTAAEDEAKGTGHVSSPSRAM